MPAFQRASVAAEWSAPPRLHALRPVASRSVGSRAEHLGEWVGSLIGRVCVFVPHRDTAAEDRLPPRRAQTPHEPASSTTPPVRLTVRAVTPRDEPDEPAPIADRGHEAVERSSDPVPSAPGRADQPGRWRASAGRLSHVLALVGDLPITRRGLGRHVGRHGAELAIAGAGLIGLGLSGSWSDLLAFGLEAVSLLSPVIELALQALVGPLAAEVAVSVILVVAAILLARRRRAHAAAVT